MNRYIALDLGQVLWSNRFGKWKQKMEEVHEDFWELCSHSWMTYRGRERALFNWRTWDTWWFENRLEIFGIHNWNRKRSLIGVLPNKYFFSSGNMRNFF